MSSDAAVSPRLKGLLDEAAASFDRLARPRILIDGVAANDFRRVYDSADANAAQAPLPDIYLRAAALALFAGTLGHAIDNATRDLFARGDAALGYIVDTVASGAADRLAQVAAEHFGAALNDAHSTSSMRVLPYSPGYCGWHVSGQRALFDRLDPSELGIELTASCLMDPIKSVSGVLVAGPPEVHRFRPTFPFCDACATHPCRTRMATAR